MFNFTSRKRSLYTFDIDEEDKKRALIESNKFKINDDNTFSGFLGEICTAKNYLNIEWSHKDGPDCGYDLFKDGIRYQIKSHRDAPYKRRFFIDDKNNDNFDRYIFVLISQDATWATVIADITRQMANEISEYDSQRHLCYINFKN